MNTQFQAWLRVPVLLAVLITTSLLSATAKNRPANQPTDRARVNRGPIGPAQVPDQTENRLPVIRVIGFSQTDIQRAIDAAPSAGASIRLPAGTYTLRANLNIAHKTNLTLDGAGAATLSGVGIGNMLCVTGPVRNLKITGLRFVCNKNNTDWYDFGLIASFEQAPIAGLEIERCTFTAPRCGINGIKLNPHSGTTGVRVANVRIHHNTFINLGRMGIELQNHGWDHGDTTYRFDGVTVSDNQFANLGLMGGNDGMAVSLSGLGQHLTIARNHVTDAKGYALELVGGRRARITGNTVRAVSNTFVGISITDNNHHVTGQITVADNSVNVRARAILIYGATDCTVLNNTLLSGQANDFIVSGSTFRANTIRTTDHNVMIFDDHCTGNRITENSFSNAGCRDCYALLSFRGQNTRGNSVTKNKLIRGNLGDRPDIEQINGASDNTLSDNVVTR